MPPVYRDDPNPAYNFQVVVTGISDDGKAVKGSFSLTEGRSKRRIVTQIEGTLPD